MYNSLCEKIGPIIIVTLAFSTMENTGIHVHIYYAHVHVYMYINKKSPYSTVVTQ